MPLCLLERCSFVQLNTENKYHVGPEVFCWRIYRVTLAQPRSDAELRLTLYLFADINVY